VKSRVVLFEQNNIAKNNDDDDDRGHHLMTCPAWFAKLRRDHERAQQKSVSRQVKGQLSSLKDLYRIELPSAPLRETLLRLFKFWLAQQRSKPVEDWLAPFSQFHSFGVKQSPLLAEATTPEDVRGILSNPDFASLRPLVSSLMYMLPSIGGDEFRQLLAAELTTRQGGTTRSDTASAKKRTHKRAKTTA